MGGTGGRGREGHEGHEGQVDLSAFAALKDRELRDEGLVIAEGRLLVTRLLEAARHGLPGAVSAACLPRPAFQALGILCVPSLAEEFGPLSSGLCPVSVMSEGELGRLAGFPFHRGVLAAAKRGALPRLENLAALPPAASRIVVLPATVDPENMGSIFRSAAALGWDGVIVGPGSCDHLSRRAIRVSMGAAFSLPVLSADGPGALAALARSGWTVAAAVLEEGTRPLRGWTAPPRLALLIGNEFEGLGAEWLGEGVERLTVPMAAGTDSLNAAAAAAVFLYETAKDSRPDG